MSCYLVKGKGWRYDFTLKGDRHTKGWFKRKRDAIKAETERREEIANQLTIGKQTPIDMDFLELVNRRLDHVEAYNSESHFKDVKYHSLRWIDQWNGLACSMITTTLINRWLKERLEISAVVANKELQYLRALFNFGVKKSFVGHNPTAGIDFFPIVKGKKYIPPKEHVIKVINAGNPEDQQYLWTIVLTAARVSEINKLTWDDINFNKQEVTLWTRKRKGGNKEPREVPMISKLHTILKHRFDHHNPDIPWVFWHSYWSRKKQQRVQGPYGDRKKLMPSLCKKAKVKYFRYHALRHLTASMLDDLGVAIGTIQRILGHKNRSTTEIYLHPIDGAARAAMSKLETPGIFDAVQTPNPKTPINVHSKYWNRKTGRPPYEILVQEIKQLGYSGTGRKYGVSDNAIRNWLRFYKNMMTGLSI